jgi:hypothetical protein
LNSGHQSFQSWAGRPTRRANRRKALVRRCFASSVATPSGRRPRRDTRSYPQMPGGLCRGWGSGGTNHRAPATFLISALRAPWASRYCLPSGVLALADQPLISL